jgi:hypothetical protein
MGIKNFIILRRFQNYILLTFVTKCNFKILLSKDTVIVIDYFFKQLDFWKSQNSVRRKFDERTVAIIVQSPFISYSKQEAHYCKYTGLFFLKMGYENS